MNSRNSKNVYFLLLFVLLLGFAFGVAYVVGSFDSTSMYTHLINGN